MLSVLLALMRAGILSVKMLLGRNRGYDDYNNPIALIVTEIKVMMMAIMAIIMMVTVIMKMITVIITMVIMVMVK